MGLKKGMTNNPHGRPKGTPNKVTAEVRTFVTKFIEQNKTQIEKDFEQLEPKERWDVYLKLLEFSIPKLQRIDANIDQEKREYNEVKIIIDDRNND